MASSLATLALIQLLPLLALFASPVSATHDGKRSVDKRQQNVTPLTFQQVGDMGISAQMVSLLELRRGLRLRRCGKRG
jgi:hypothetical protein